MSQWILLRRIRVLGARVYLHWSVLAVAGLLALMSFSSPIHAAVAIVSYLSVVLLHEVGHAWMARRLGYDVDSIRVAFLHGRCEYEAPYSETDEVLIAWGGVLAQLAVAAPILIVAALFGQNDFGYAAPAVVFLGYVNLLIALVNLAPAPELDGHIAWRAIPLFGQWLRARRDTKRTVNDLTRRKGSVTTLSSRRRR